MPCPDAVTALIELVTSPGNRPSIGGDLETMLAPGACLGCGGTVWYPYDGRDMWDGGNCKHCGPVDLVTLRGGFVHRFKRRAT